MQARCIFVKERTFPTAMPNSSGGATRIPARDAQSKTELLDLSPFYNWPSANDGVMLVPGLHHLAGVDFDARAVIQVASASGNAESFPKKVTGIPVGRKATRLHFLHATSGAPSSKEVKTGSYVIHYADGQQTEIPLVYGREIGPFDTPPNPVATTSAELTWTGIDRRGGKKKPALQLFKFTWKNPRAEVEVRSFDLISALTEQAPSLLAITVE